MPVYNCEKTIRKTLESIVTQDYLNWKLFISDNFSSDSTKLICEEFVNFDSRIMLISQRENIGAWNNFKFVLDNSYGNYFKFQAGDDVLSENYFAVNIEALDQNVRLAGSTSPDCWDWEFNKEINAISFDLKGSKSTRLRKLRENCWRSNGMFYGIYRREILETVITKDLFDSRIMILDWLILARIILIGEINRCSKGLMVMGSAGASNSGGSTWFTDLRGWKTKIFPYLGFLKLLKRDSGYLELGQIREVILWISILQIGHIKGLIRLFVGKICSWD